MPSWLSEDLNERETVAKGPVRLNGWSLTNTGTEERFVGFKDGDRTGPMIVVPPGEEVRMSGLLLPFPSGLGIESLTGDGTLIANVFFEERGLPEAEEAEEAPPVPVKEAPAPERDRGEE